MHDTNGADNVNENTYTQKKGDWLKGRTKEMNWKNTDKVRGKTIEKRSKDNDSSCGKKKTASRKIVVVYSLHGKGEPQKRAKINKAVILTGLFVDVAVVII